MHQMRLARPEEADRIMEFINRQWQDGHLLATDREFFLYQYQTEADYLNFAIAVNPDHGGIDSLLGFTPTNRAHDFFGCRSEKSTRARRS
jgi:hypothetical protein